MPTPSLPPPLHRPEVNAGILLWQSWFRLGVLAAIVASSVVFRLLGFSDAGSLGRHWLGAPGHLLAVAAVSLAYVAFVLGARHALRRRGRAGVPMLVAHTTADALVLLAGVALLAPPDAYPRGLLLSFFSLQLAQLYFGRALTVYAAAVVVLLYGAIVAAAVQAGVLADWRREVWTLWLYALGVSGFVLLQGGLSARLARLGRLFDRVEEGDFSLAYDVEADRRPDHVTAVGRAYNRMRAQLATVVLTDQLTGCVNRRGFEEQLAREVARAARAGTPLSLLALDVDHFKTVNDTFGHLAGDEALREIGQLLRDTARAGDVVARIGGEEFMLVAPSTDADGAAHLAERIADAFRARAFAAVGDAFRVTVSVGVVTEANVREGAAEDLRARADEALYASKRAGRDRVTVWTGRASAYRVAGAPDA